jgi:hypothetical protein
VQNICFSYRSVSSQRTVRLNTFDARQSNGGGNAFYVSDIAEQSNKKKERQERDEKCQSARRNMKGLSPIADHLPLHFPDSQTIEDEVLLFFCLRDVRNKAKQTATSSFAICLKWCSQCPRGLRHELSSPDGTLESWVRGMDMCLYYISAALCVGSGLPTGWSPSKGTYRHWPGSNKWKCDEDPIKGSKAAIIIIIMISPIVNDLCEILLRSWVFACDTYMQCVTFRRHNWPPSSCYTFGCLLSMKVAYTNEKPANHR